MKVTQSELKLLIKEQVLKIKKIDELNERKLFIKNCLSKIESGVALTESEEKQLDEGFLGGVARLGQGFANNVAGGVKSFVKNPVQNIKNAAINTAAALVLPKEGQTQKFMNTFEHINGILSKAPVKYLKGFSDIVKRMQNNVDIIKQTLNQREQQSKMPLTQF